ncbi:MAG: HyaD/HybD family hydrogenase maturation endopeptidase [Gemmatimonadota bacterium]|nr:HyaD/HybD family hydrogenase maturation endopeptidase [Gemmatimonadota bacterium]
MTDAPTVVLGVGSPLMGDDGVGVEVVELLRRRWEGDPSVAFLDGGTWGMQILPFIESARRLLVLDAIRDGRSPGTVVRLSREEIPRYLFAKVSPHQIDLREVFALAELRGTFPEEAVALGIEPAVVELRDGLSSEVRASLPALVEDAEGQLAAWGHAPRVREVAHHA